MKLNTRAQEPSFTENKNDYVLKINNFPEINFPKNRLYTSFGTYDDWIKSAHTSYNFHEPGMLEALIFIKEKGFKIRSILDIGSLYGYFSKICESLFDDAKIYAIEPNYDSYKILVESSKYNKNNNNNIECEFMAISDLDQSNYKIFYGFDFLSLSFKNIFIFSVKNFVKFLLRKSNSPFLKIWKLKEESLKYFCENRNISPDLIKIDVEGRQAKIIPPAYKFIFETKPIILLEFDSLEKLNIFDTSNQKIVEPLLKNGYKLFWGDHRKIGCEFEEVTLEDLNQKKINVEKDGLGILLPQTFL